MNISLSTHFEDFIAEQVDSGNYASASEVIRAGLDRLAYEQKMRGQVLEKIDLGLADVAAGRYEEVGVDELDAYFEKIWNQVIEERRKELYPNISRAAS